MSLIALNKSNMDNAIYNGIKYEFGIGNFTVDNKQKRMTIILSAYM